MRGYRQWNHRPYVRLHEREKRNLPHICQIIPGDHQIELEWFDMGCNGPHTLQYRPWQKNCPWLEIPADQTRLCIPDLLEDMDYEFRIIRNQNPEEKSLLRLARTGKPEGSVVAYNHPADKTHSSGNCLCTCSVLKLPSGNLLACHDYFHEGSSNLAKLYKSFDAGETWHYVTDIFPAFWPSLFMHRGKVYILAAEGEFGNLIVGCSEDEGETWSAPTRIILGGSDRDVGFHKGAVPVIEHNGRLYTAVEYGRSPQIPLYAGLLSIDADADLLVPENWSLTEVVGADYHWPGMPKSSYGYYMEGNPVAAPDGSIYDLLRLDPLYPIEPNYNRAVLLKGNLNDPEEALKFDQVIDMPVGVRNKFCVRYDPETKLYFALGNETSPIYRFRTVVSLSVSSDLIHWRVLARPLDYHEYDASKVAYQYPHYDFDGEDIIFVCRTAWNHANSSHDNNYITFHRIKNFRKLL